MAGHLQAELDLLARHGIAPAVQPAGVASLNGWQVPAQPLRLGGGSKAEEYLSAAINHLNQVSIPRAARYYVLNEQILVLKRAGQAGPQLPAHSQGPP